MSLSKKHHLYWGTIIHRRHTPFTRFFKYPIFMAYIDITSLSTTMSPSLLWNINKPAIVSFRRSDYHGDPQVEAEAGPNKIQAPRAEAIKLVVNENVPIFLFAVK